MSKPELLSPAGNFEKLKFALAFGADAVYASGKGTGLRNFSDNFTEEELKEAVEYTHSFKKKIYMTVNIFPRNSDIPKIRQHLKFLDLIKPDAIIISDLGVLKIIREEKISLPIHVSVQANNLNYMEVKMWKELGAKRVILARELNVKEIKEIKEKLPDIELEAFVHGAMCISYSGRCLISNYMTGRDANRGECTQGCRWSYELIEAKRPGEKIPVVEDERGTYIFNSKDLNLLEKLGELYEAGIESFKIEGRMKGIHYVAAVTNAYRKCIDAGFNADEILKSELNKISHREYTTGFYFDDGEIRQNYATSDYSADSVYLGHTIAGGVKEAEVIVRNVIRLGDKIEIFSPKGKKNDEVTGIFDESGIEVTKTSGKSVYKIKFKTGNIESFSVLRKSID